MDSYDKLPEIETPSEVDPDTSGATLIEYALLVALIALIALSAVSFFGHRVSKQFSNISDSIP